jgi:prolycopene isomerase
MLPAGVIPPKRIHAFQAAELYSSCVTISAGLDCEPQSLGFGEELVFLTRDGISRKAHSSGDPQVAGLSVLAPSLRDPTVAPPGKGTMTVYCSANLDYGDRWKTGPDLERGDAYKAFKNEYAQVVLERVENAIAPGLRKHIEILAIATPVTHLRYTGNKDGTIMGQMPSRGNIRARVAGSRTPVRNLLVGGHWAQYGGGVPVAVAAGSNAALIIFKKERPSAYAALSKVLDSPWPGPVAARASTPARHPAPEESVPAP